MDTKNLDEQARKASAEKVYHWCIICGFGEEAASQARANMMSGGDDLNRSYQDFIDNLFKGRK